MPESAKPELNRSQVIALFVAVLAGMVALAASAIAKTQSPGGVVDADSMQLDQQLSAAGGIIVALLVDTVVKDKRLVFLVSSGALFMGALGPWLPRMIEAPSLAYNLAVNFGKAGAGAFTFGVAFLVKASSKAASDA